MSDSNKNKDLFSNGEILTNFLNSLEEDDFKKEFASRFRDYGLYVIKDRAVPDVRDGLKPVQRRILYAMQVGGYTSGGKTFKSARIVGDVIGKYHPHGDTSVYEAMVRMTQPWTYRYPLVYGQGNFGSIDGDNPAAMRYTESKLDKFGELSLGKKLKMNAVDFNDNYDGSTVEPDVLPAEIPYLLLNSVSGIAVGIAADFVPHNIKEVLAVCKRFLKYRIKNEKGDKNKLVQRFITGPDFPTGGTVITSEKELSSIYSNGRGKVTVRAKIEKESLAGGKWNLVVTEIPYGVKKEDIIISISDMIHNKKLHVIEDIYDETDKDDIRIVIVPKSKKLNFEDVMLHLYSVSALQVTVKVNMYALIEGGEKPKRMSFAEIVDRWLDFHIETTIRAAKFRLDKVIKRLHLLDGFMIAYLNIDRVISIIRTEEDPESVLSEEFSLSDAQVAAIIELKLRQLKKIGEEEIKKEQNNLYEEKDHLNSLINDDVYRTDSISKRFDQILKDFGDDRRTEISFGSAKAKTLSDDLMIDKEPATALMTKYGFVKFLKNGASIEKTKKKEGDELLFVDSGYTTDYVAFVTKSGQVFTKIVAELPTARTEGKHLGEFFTVNHNDPVIHMFVVNATNKYVITTDAGHTFIILGSDIINKQKKGKKVFNPDKLATKFIVHKLNDENAIAFLSSVNTFGIVPLEQFPELAKGKGVQSIRLKKGDTIVNTELLSIDSENKKIDFGQDRKFNIDYEQYVIERAKGVKKLDTRIVNRMTNNNSGEDV